jgi:hypothetical protein
MATTVAHVSELLRERDLQFSVDTSGSQPHILTGFQTRHYRNEAGELQIDLVIGVYGDGEFVKLFCPGAFKAGPENVAASALACCVIQWRTPLIQFEIDHSDGEIRPVVELPLIDAELTAAQLAYCIETLLTVVDRFAGVVQHAAAHGEIDFSRYVAGDDEEVTAQQLSNLLSEFTPAQIERALSLLGMRS